MLCHFGQDLHDQHKQFNTLFTEIVKIGNEANRSVESIFPLRSLFLQDFSCLEKVLVLINVVLFAVSLSADDQDQEISTAILYMMFAIIYFVTTTTCLSGASALKRKACW